MSSPSAPRPGAQPILGSRAATTCARRLHNEWDPTLVRVLDGAPAPVTPGPVQERIEAGAVWRAEMLDRLVAAVPGGADLRDLPDTRETRVRATVDAMEAGASLVVGGWLPDDVAGGRSGRPALLLRSGSREGPAGYLPGVVKAHKVLAAADGVTTWISTPGDPGSPRPHADQVLRRWRYDDLTQVAHYWRMLEALGRTPAGLTPTGLVLSTDAVDGEPAMVWADLALPRVTTFSRSRGRALRSSLERHDHEHGFRVEVARVAAARRGTVDDADGPAPLVRPIFVPECETCPWSTVCHEIAGPDEPSGHVVGLSVREWNALHRCEVRTLDQLAALDGGGVEDPDFLASYLPEVTHRDDALTRLRLAARRARMVATSVSVERTTEGAVPVPRAAVEIDLDTEWGTDDRVYLWGALAPDGFHAFADFAVLDETSERTLAERFAAWLRATVADAAGRGEEVRVYHYTAVEPKQLARVLGRDAVADLLPLFFDLWPLVRDHYVGVRGLGLKVVAPQFGFAWRDEDPGGLQSQEWLVSARGEGGASALEAAAARQRILDYNEDDVRATAVVREALGRERGPVGTLDGSALVGPGTPHPGAVS